MIFLRKKQKENFSSKEDGFTLIEILFVLVLAGGVFMALYAIFGKTISNDEENKNEVIASNLAQEGVEIVRNIRDENFLASDSIGTGLPSLGGDCHPFVNSSGNSSCGSRIDRIEKDSNGIYQNCPSSGCTNDETIFERTCSIGSAGGVGQDEAFAVSCVVTWKGLSGIERKARAMSVLTDWQDLGT